MNCRLLVLAPFLAGAACAQVQPHVAREGRHWVEAVTGAIDAEYGLKVLTRGAIALHGESRGDVSYTVKKRAVAASERQARDMLARIAVKAYRQKNWTVVNVSVPEYLDGAADVELRVPKRLKETVLETVLGAVEAYDLDGGLLAKSGGGRIQVDRVWGWAKLGTGGGDVKVGKVGGFLKGFSSGGSIEAAFVNGDAYLETEGGEIAVKEAKGRVQASAGAGGNIRIWRADGGAMLSTGGGVIDVYQVSGPVRANTGSGAIKVHAAANVQATSGAGQIQLREAHGTMHAITAVGSIIVDLAAAKPLADSELTTQQGDITIYIPSNVAVTVQATNASPGGHRIVSEFAEIRPRLEGGNMRSEANGALNGGGPVLRLSASGGTIYLRRRE